MERATLENPKKQFGLLPSEFVFSFWGGVGWGGELNLLII